MTMKADSANLSTNSEDISHGSEGCSIETSCKTKEKKCQKPHNMF